MCTKMLYRLNIVFYISRDCQQISLLILSEVLFTLKIPGFSNDFRKIPKNSGAILVMNTPGRKNVSSKSAIETPEQTVKITQGL